MNPRESGPCSICAAISCSTSVSSTPSSATTTISLGPAGRSIATSWLTINFAVFTAALPGPKILSTGAIDSVPYAMAAIACAPPIAHTSSIPSSAAAAATAAAPLGGVQTTIRSTPATCAGMPVIMSEETRFLGT